MKAALVAALSVLAACHAELDAPTDMLVDASSPPDMARPPAKCNVIFDNLNINGVLGGAVSPTFSLADDSYELCSLFTYHWNNETGAPAGTIGLKNVTTGTSYGPYQAKGSDGQGGKRNTNWDVVLDPHVPLEAGDYRIVDSDPASWSWNNAPMEGFTRVSVAR